MKTQHIVEIAFSHYRKGDYEKASEAFLKAISLHPTDPFYYMGLGLVRMCLDDLTGGLKSFSYALQLDDKLDLAYYYRSVCRKNAEEFTVALEDINAAIGLRIRPGQYMGERGRIKHLNGDLLGALIDLIRAVKWDYGYNYVNYLYRSQLFMELKEYDMALEDLGNVIRLNPEVSEAYLYKSECHMEMGNQDLADKELLSYKTLMKTKK